MSIKKELPKIKENILLADYTTFKIGGPGRYFLTVKNRKELIEAVKTAKKFKAPFFILGGGSNTLFSDKGFKGMVIKCQTSGIKRKNNMISAESGVLLKDLVELALDNSLTGLEWAVKIPGTLGGAVSGNAQAFGSRMSDSVKSAKAFDTGDFKIKNFSKKECNFSLKNSIFKNNKNLIIISAVLKLKKGNKKEIKEKIKDYTRHRKRMHPLDYPCAGSVFINPEIKITDKRLFKKFPDLEEQNKKRAIPSAYLIERCGLKGKKIGGAQFSKKHANFIINLNKAKSKDVKDLIKLAKERVKKTFGVVLKEEIQIIE
ncbi:MAG: UDP-N-acetylmuramate dehydrogenase [Candidatus Pacebacteria bacterium]|nr:UDP-N-acetylmuramate dehydrogenase [Candidatus Paceibacterota bacterium]